MKYIDETLAELEKARQRFDSVIVSYSGGKDSLCVMDLCMRTFPKVQAFIMEYIPGLSLTDKDVDYAQKKWGIPVRRYLHFATVNDLANGVFCDSHWKTAVDEYSVTDLYAQVRKDAGATLIATGVKRADGIWRRRVMARAQDRGDILTPLAGWQKAHVVGYLNMRGIPVPPDETKGARHNGLNLSVPSILWLHDNHPGDFKKLLEVFPYAQAVIERRKFYPDYLEAAHAARKVRDDDDSPLAGEAG